MISISSIEIGTNSTERSAVAVIQTRETADLCIVVVLSYLEMGKRKFPRLYVSAEFAAGNVEQTWPLKICPSHCTHALTALVGSAGFKKGILEPLVRKVLEVHSNPAAG